MKEVNFFGSFDFKDLCIYLGLNFLANPMSHFEKYDTKGFRTPISRFIAWP